ncbi:hypothetical protein [Xanthomonas hortorum]|uniref:Uncharacterized protein n=1 Tax=Xanthomonas hortorum pv. pelargonii TaxID=453602 RepID=A0A6V7CCK5_9XANT|nr:hypothetical protein [Xanthomonas hortorum]MCE4356286.1 hypothetical protein [Xanthomonas hortorum pv. pelargonii]MCM5526079.1 hypothetical protein [Xanthomonas hortorum pv. pelargonii]MCM5538289.1 hypothetical protein [Xanthomonas hortorum pv. pelargonii]MCM5542463.1 hypothetical protein [Xanthomonas hortorum pv. pelargonii]MCM5546233.1 hypothetical protein [Xanthomonas hortorum pv. pelargonii]
MDPIAAASGLATIVSLASDFVAQRKSSRDADIEEFKSWLATQRHDDVIALLESNQMTASSTKAFLRESHQNLMKRLDDLNDLLIHIRANGATPVSQAPSAIETITLGELNKFTGTPSDQEALATRIALHAIEQKAVQFKVNLEKTVVSVAANDQLLLARYEQSRIKLAKELEERLTFLTSPLAQDAWRYFLSTTQDWNLAIGKFIKLASLDPNDRHSGKKIDVWRTEEPEVFSGIYLNSEEISAMLNHLDFSSMRDLAMGSHWRAAIDLPSEMITWHVIPAITIALRAKNIDIQSDMLALHDWHIGEG